MIEAIPPHPGLCQQGGHGLQHSTEELGTHAFESPSEV